MLNVAFSQPGIWIQSGSLFAAISGGIVVEYVLPLAGCGLKFALSALLTAA